MAQFPPDISLKELTRSQTAVRKEIDNSVPKELMNNAIRIAWFLQSLRDKLNEIYDERVYITISSGYRCGELNTAIGGSQTSAHQKALAADIHVNVMTPYELSVFIRDNMVEEGFDQVIHEFGQWVHVGLSEGQPRLQSLTAMKVNGKTKYELGILEVA